MMRAPDTTRPRLQHWLCNMVLCVALIAGCIPESTPPKGDAGARCSRNTDCSFGLTCLTDGFPGGYCSALDCEQTGCPANTFGASAPCAHLDEDRTTTACVQGCSSDAQCRQTEGYVCADLEGVSGCMPTELAAASAGQVGSSCVTNLNCNDDLTCLTNFLAGYCSRPCTADADCGEEAACADLGGGVLRCLDRCNDDAQCRFGYGCQTVGEAAGVCYPDTNRN